jgi:CBS domain-containing protein
MATAQSLMRMRLLTAEPGEPVAHAVERMAELNLGAVLVTEGGRLAGIFSERDLLRRVVAARLDPAATPIGEVATLEPVTVTAATPIGECARLVRERDVRHLPVVDAEGRPVGILSTRDLLHLALDQLDELVDRARGGLRAEELTDPYEPAGG